MDIHQIHIALKALDFWVLFTCIGLLIARLWLLPVTAFAIPPFLQRWHRLLGLGLAVLTFTGLALLLVRSTEMAGASIPETLPLLPQVLQQAHFGHVWSIHLGALALLWAGWGMARRLSVNSGVGIMLAAVLVLLFTYSATSHAADSGDFRLPEFNDWLHLLAAAAWGGGILAMVLFILPAWRMQREPRLVHMADVARRLSTLSAFALLAVLLTGLLNAALRLGDFSALVTTPYGRILGLKLLLVAGMMLIGAINRFVLVPNLGRGESVSAKGGRACGLFCMALRVDSALVLLVLVVAAFLIQGMPPAAMAGMTMDTSPPSQEMPMRAPRELAIENAWVRQMAPGQDTAEAFMDITSPVDATLEQINTPQAEQVEIHSMHLEHGIMRMQQMPAIALPAGRTVRLSPGVIHLMLIHPKHRLRAGEHITFRLTVQNPDHSRIERSISAPVLREAPAVARPD